jgi:hypothetical protein
LGVYLSVFEPFPCKLVLDFGDEFVEAGEDELDARDL